MLTPSIPIEWQVKVDEVEGEVGIEASAVEVVSAVAANAATSPRVLISGSRLPPLDRHGIVPVGA
jgi:hypothetical protein